ncbi:MAG: chemotaxis response regulator protein-glutamate methylesterase [Pirellulaceae bacterium]|nr:chemotaxis response regulator protein-glutamate methylesterase [Pirellulaceae bacterium]
MRKVRVLVVDDSTVIRRLLTDALSSDPAVEVAATAPNGRIALAKIPQINPDVITLDMEMPEMDGITTLVELRKLYPKLPVIMFSTLTQRGAEATLDALAKGANDYVTKPANVGSVTAALQNVRNELVPKIKAFCPWSAAPMAPLVTKQNEPGSRAVKSVALRNARIDCIAIGVSTGGPSALQTVLTKLPGNLPVPVVIVQHMPPIFTKHLADRLHQLSELDVFEGMRGDALSPGGVWIAPGDHHMIVRRDGPKVRIDTHQQPPENSCRPAVDVLFRSVAEVYGEHTLGVVLTGMGQDGARGAEVMRDAGGRIIAQDEKSSVVWGMPGAVVGAGLADKVVPLDQIAFELIRETDVGRINRSREMVKA